MLHLFVHVVAVGGCQDDWFSNLFRNLLVFRTDNGMFFLFLEHFCEHFEPRARDRLLQAKKVLNHELFARTTAFN